MTITLRPEHEALIAQAIQSGAYQTADQVVERALEVLRSEDERLREDKESVHEKIERAFEQFERGEFFTAEESRANMEKRKAVWLASQKQG
jgi:putative addiction module CopG family antidote